MRWQECSTSLFLAAALAICSNATGNSDQHNDSTKERKCEEPAKPIDANRLRLLARQETERREKKTVFTTFEVSWGAHSCTWLVVASIDNPGPGEDRIMTFSNDGKLLTYDGGR